MTEGNLKSLLHAESPGTPSGRIVRALRERGSLSAAQIARLTGLARSTVSIAVSELRHSGLVTEAEQQPEPGAKPVGRPGTVLTLNPEAGTCVGVHLTLDSLRVAIADVSHSFIEEQNIPLEWDYSPETAARVLNDWINRTYQRNGLRRSALLGLGVSVSAPVGPDGTVHRASIVPTWAGVNVVRVFSETLRTTVLADNESNCSAIAEMTWGAAAGCEDFVLFKLDIGVGGSIVTGGKVQRGVAGGAGEFGHISLDPAGALCRCGNRGCLELTAGFASALQQLSLIHRRNVTMDDVVALARTGDVGTLRMIADTAECAGRGLAMVCGVVNPPLVLVNGALAKTGRPLLDPLIAAFEKHALLRPSDLPEAQRTRIVPGALIENDVVLGAVGLVLRHHGRFT